MQVRAASEPPGRLGDVITTCAQTLPGLGQITADAARKQEPPAEGSAEKLAAARRRGRFGDAVASLVIAGLILLLEFAPASRLAARDLPRPPPGLAPEVAGSQQGKPRPSMTFPWGCPEGPGSGQPEMCIVTPDAALGPSDAWPCWPCSSPHLWRRASLLVTSLVTSSIRTGIGADVRLI
jgi:hypothetical protein